ncbi:MAG: hypothetical protein V1746_06145 [bacterium]
MMTSQENLLPKFVPLPSGNTSEFFSGLKRGKLNQLILPCKENGWKPPVKSIAVRPKGCLRGKRLILLESLLSFLEQTPQDGAEGTANVHS